MAKLTTAKKNAEPKSDFALPEQPQISGSGCSSCQECESPRIEG